MGGLVVIAHARHAPAAAASLYCMLTINNAIYAPSIDWMPSPQLRSMPRSFSGWPTKRIYLTLTPFKSALHFHCSLVTQCCVVLGVLQHFPFVESKVCLKSEKKYFSRCAKSQCLDSIMSRFNNGSSFCQNKKRRPHIRPIDLDTKRLFWRLHSDSHDQW